MVDHKKRLAKKRTLRGSFIIFIGIILLVGIGITIAAFISEQARLNPTQRKIMTILKAEYAAQPDGTKYTEGRDEYWCADFVSWVMKEAGVPLANKDGHWRIDDVPPLIEYYKKEGRFFAADSGYVPKPGDVVMYQPPSTMGNHANIVVENDNGVLTTIGGNENDQIRAQVRKAADDKYLVGYGTLK